MTIALTVASLTGRASAQFVPSAPQQQSDQVYVRDSAIAIEKFALAERMERLHEWSKAADIYQEVLKEHADRVVPDKSGDASSPAGDAQPTRYVSVVAAVQEHLSRWPREGLDAYHSRFDADAQSMLSDAAPDDRAALHQVFSKYFITNAGKAAGVRLIDLSLERGDFSAASWMAQRLLTTQPDLAADRAPLQYRAIVAAHFAGDTSLAESTLADLERTSPDALGKVRGEDVRLLDAAKQVLATPPPVAAPSSPVDAGESWRTAFGDASRGRVAPAVTSLGARLFSVPLARQENAISLNARGQAALQIEGARQLGVMTNVYPVVDRGELYFQDNAFIYALDLETGLPLPGWAQTYDGDRNGKYAIAKTVPMPRGSHQTITLSDDALFTVVGQPDYMAMGLGVAAAMQPHDTRLVCLDRATGRERYVIRPAQLTGDRVPATMKELDFSGSPLLVDGRLYLTARGGKGTPFEDCYVVCLDALTGEFKWATYVASASSASAAAMEIDESASGQTLSHLSAANGRIFCLTNLGAVAAIDAYDGSIAWLSIYSRDVSDTMNFSNRRFAPLAIEKSWSLNPIIVLDGKVFSLPVDGKELTVYNVADGRVLNRLPLHLRIQRVERGKPYAASSNEAMDCLIGVIGSQVYICGNRTIAAVDWTKPVPADAMSSGLIDTSGKPLVWYRTFDKGAGAKQSNPAGGNRSEVPPLFRGPQTMLAGEQPTIAGRPFLSDKSLYVPTRWDLQCISLRTAKVDWTYPGADRAWGDGEEAGNVLATSQHVIVAGPKRVTIYTDLAIALQKLDAAVAAAPHDAAPQLRYAEIMFVSGRPDLAAKKLDEAIDLLGGPEHLPEASAERNRVYLDAQSFAQKLSNEASSASTAAGSTTRPSKPGVSPDVIDHLFDRAVAAAQLPSQQVSVRLARADFARAQNDASTELRLYHEILARPDWRSLSISRRGDNSDATNVLAAAEVARGAVQQIIQRPGGPELYQAYETRASRDAQASKTALNPAAMLEVSQAYPNARAADEAIAWAADAYESSGDFSRAVQTLREQYFHTSDSRLKLTLLESIARNTLMLPNRADSAAARLAQIVKNGGGINHLSRSIRLPDGRTLTSESTIADALAALNTQRAALAQDMLPEMKLGVAGDASPFKSADATVVADQISGLCAPLRGFERNDRVVVTKVGTGISVFAAANPTPLFTSNAIATNLNGCAWTGGNLVAWNVSKLVMLDGESGQTSWEFDPSKVPSFDVVDTSRLAVGQPDTEPKSDAGEGNSNLLPEQAAMAARRGRIRLGANQRIAIQARPAVAGVAARGAGLNGNVNLLDAADNDDANPSQLVESIIAVRLSSDRVIVATSAGRLLAMNLVDGKMSWQKFGATPGRSVVRLEVTDDFAATYSTDDFNVAAAQGFIRQDGGTNNAAITCFDTASGRIVYQKSFVSDLVAAAMPVTLALSSDGLLVWALPDRVVGKDLFEPANAPPRFGSQPLPGDENSQPYACATGSDSLIVNDGRLLILAENGVCVRELSIDTGELLKGADGTQKRRATGFHPNEGLAGFPNLRMVNSMLYVASFTSLVAHDLTRDGASWHTNPIESAGVRFAGVLVGRDQLAIASTTLTPQEIAAQRNNIAAIPGQPPVGNVRRDNGRNRVAKGSPPELRIFIHTRAKLPAGGEDGSVQFSRPFTTHIGLPFLAVQGTDGGIYYLSADQKLCFLPGAHADEPANH